MRVHFKKGAVASRSDSIECIRADGTSTTGDLPRQGVLPRAAIRFVVETTLPWPDGVYAAIASGATYDQALAPPDRAAAPGSIGSDALLDCIEAEQWGGAVSLDEFNRRLSAACRRRGLRPIRVTADGLQAVRTALRAFGAAWRPLPPGGVMERSLQRG